MTLTALLLSFAVVITAPQHPLENAQAHFDAGRYAEAVETLSAVLQTQPKDASIHYWLARSYYEQRAYDKAVTHAESAVKLAPQDAEFQRWLGRAYGAKAEQSRSFFLARKVKQAFEAAVRLAPRSIEARRDLMQYLAEAPWIVGGSKGKAREQVTAISQLDPLAGRLAQAAYLTADKKWKEAETEYLAIIAQRPSRMEPYMEAADFFANRKDAENLERVLAGALQVNAGDPRLDFYRGVVLILRGGDRTAAEKLLTFYIANVPERSDYPSHNTAKQWLLAGK
jgi:tetratricopeptide (TPR) repeat protein